MPWARASLRVLLARVSLAHDYGAVGAALFDIVNVQNWTRRRTSGPFKQVRFHTWSGAAILLSIFKSWLSSSGRALAS
jgi:hypothetical protein